MHHGHLHGSNCNCNECDPLVAILPVSNKSKLLAELTRERDERLDEVKRTLERILERSKGAALLSLCKLLSDLTDQDFNEIVPTHSAALLRDALTDVTQVDNWIKLAEKL